MKIDFFKKKNTQLYAIHTGVYAGEFWVHIKKDETQYHFLAVPTMLSRQIPCNIFDSGLKSGIVKFVENIPNKVHEICCQQYNKNLNNYK